jgi:hypothetical protein
MPIEKLIIALRVGLQAAADMSAAEHNAYKAVIAAAERFEGHPPSDFQAALNKLKPLRSREATTNRLGRVSDAQITALVARLEAARLDYDGTTGIVAEVAEFTRADVLRVAKAAGVHTNSRTTKDFALKALRTRAKQELREAELAVRIKAGA